MVAQAVAREGEQMKATWVDQGDDYDGARWRLIDSDKQRYIGVVVVGQGFNVWQAFAVETADKSTALGVFNTSKGAKIAVEMWWAAKEAEQTPLTALRGLVAALNEVPTITINGRIHCTCRICCSKCDCQFCVALTQARKLLSEEA
jgi:hypothetical protein